MAFKVTLLKIWSNRVDCVNISLIANNPTTTGINPMPSENSLIPNVNLSIEVIKSYPTVEMRMPKVPAMRFLIGLPSPIEANIVNPKIAKAKYSGCPNS